MSTRGAHSWVRKTPTGLPALDEQRLVVGEAPQLADDGVEGLPAARGAARAAVDDEVVRVLGDLGIEVVHEHPQGRPPAASRGRGLGPARGALTGRGPATSHRVIVRRSPTPNLVRVQADPPANALADGRRPRSRSDPVPEPDVVGPDAAAARGRE